jgi:hypothetical protein
MYAIMAGDVGKHYDGSPIGSYFSILVSISLNKNCTDCLELLCQYGADLEMQTLTGNTAIMNAVREEE